jgi:hypothetical protein
MAAGSMPGVGAEIEILLDEQQESQSSAGRLGWQEVGMEPVRQIVQENPELAGTIKELMEGALAWSTMQSYQGAITRYQEFCESAGYDRADITEKSVLHYVTHLRHQKASLATLCQVKPALTLLLELYTGGTAPLTPRVNRWLAAAKRLAAENREPVKKAAELPFEVLEKMVKKVISPHWDQPEKVSAMDFRCIVKSVVIYYTFCRFSDYKQLQARHVEVQGEDLVITFPKSKNDQFHRGQSTVLKANGSDMCPVRLLRLYFHRFGLKFGEPHGDVTYLHCMFRKSGGRHHPDRKPVGGASLARENLHDLLRRMGQDPSRITDKSIKMLGVTKTIEAGASTREVAHQGRWRTEDMPLHYKHNSLEYKKYIAGKVPHQ